MALLPTAVHVRFSNRPFWVISCRDGLHFWCPPLPPKAVAAVADWHGR
jgi:hypothetical protein